MLVMYSWLIVALLLPVTIHTVYKFRYSCSFAANSCYGKTSHHFRASILPVGSIQPLTVTRCNLIQYSSTGSKLQLSSSFVSLISTWVLHCQLI